MKFTKFLSFMAFLASILLSGCTISEMEMPEKSANQHISSLQGANVESDSNNSIALQCCNCTMTVTNRSSIYTTAVALSPDWDGSPSCGPLGMNAVLTPAGTLNSSSTASGSVKSAGLDGMPNIFYLQASNTGDENAQTDCVHLRIVINCGGNTYDRNITTEPHVGVQYYVAQFGVDAEGQPETCNLVPLNLSWRCRNNPQNCLPNCHGITPNG